MNENINLPTILICLLIAGCVVLVIRRMIRDRKQGKTTCGGHCAGCPMSGSCHERKVEELKKDN